MADEEEKPNEDDTEENKPADDEGADGEESEDGEEGTPKKKKSKKKLIIIAVIVLVVLLCGGAGLYFSGILGGGSAGDGDEGGSQEEAGKAVYYTLPEFLVNLNTSSRSSSFLKTIIILEVPKEEDIPLIEANLPRLIDSMNTYLRELRSSDLAGSAGIQRLREELLIRANKSLSPVKINDILFKEIVVQ